MSIKNNEIIYTALASFPPGVKNFLKPHPLDSLKRTLTPYETTIHLSTKAAKVAELASRLHPIEAAQLMRLDQKERTYAELFEKSHKPLEVFVSRLYNQIKASTDPLDTRTHDTLALTTFAMSRVFAQDDRKFELWPTNRLALVRGINSWLEDSHTDNGLIIQSATSAGKSLTVTPGILPALLLIRPHIDVAAQRPTTRDRNEQRFKKLADVFSIRVGTFAPEKTIQRVRPGLISVSLEPEHEALFHDVTFLKLEDLGLQLIREIQTKNPRIMVEGSRRGLILDEVDATTIDERLVPMVISGPEQNIVTALLQEWHIAGDKGKIILKLTAGEQKFSKSLTDALLPDMELLSSLLDNKLKQPISQHKYSEEMINFVHTMSLTRKIFSFLPDLRVAETPKHRPYFGTSGDLTSDGWYDVFRRLWLTAQQRPYDNQAHLPKNWEVFFEKIIPVHVQATITSIDAHIRLGADYIREKDTKETLLSSFTGYPLEGREYDSLTRLLLWSRDTIENTALMPPASVHNNTDELTLDELLALAYSKFLCLTGSQLDSPTVYLLEKAHDLAVTIIPSTKEGVTVQPNSYIPVLSKHEKSRELAKRITDRPALIEVRSIETGEQLARYLGKAFPKHTVALLTAKNASEASTIIARAGNVNAITITRGMVKREEDIMLTESAQKLGGLQVFGYEPGAYASDDLQLAGRAGRRGEHGSYICFASPTDEIFHSIGSPAYVRKIFANGDKKRIFQLIREGQENNRNRQLTSIETQILRIAPINKLRKELHALTDFHTRSLVLFVWPSFLTLIKVRFQEYASGWRSQSPVLRFRMQNYQDYTKSLFRDLVAKAKTPGQTKEKLEEWFITIANNDATYDDYWPKKLK